MEKLSGKTVLVTGSTDGVGRLADRKLGEAGARVLVHGRDAERGARVVSDMEASGGAGTFLAADLSALAEVRRLAGAVRATADRLDILINNADIGTAGPRQTSAEGVRAALCGELSRRVSAYLAPVAPCQKSTPARIVNVSSAGQQPIDFGDVMLTRGYPRV
jgi:NAD(P)-dependent dehydrogenase (short-subunit alcohol dehydrogenase family)